MDFLLVIDSLMTASSIPNETSASFCIIVSSLLDYILNDTAYIFNTLITNVLEYRIYTIHRSDFDSNVLVYAIYLTGILFLLLSLVDFLKYNITLNIDEEFQENLSIKINTIGLAFHDNPIEQLSWMAEKYISCKISNPSIFRLHLKLRCLKGPIYKQKHRCLSLHILKSSAKFHSTI
ncbi:uncharacterized protein Bfra_009401 [Botrytis fragariae]|uniref:Uncharacterized protein n=1 Tax=Botrytis fragariae TaxID=1964551 RepID=A0A8H6ANY4_9HELO|nr:uncharacterized protein Bfra_009401 [Botrytis fragariae]KAF5870846.1 hypothetical protein Bfra_009401 [Botrytis fragariae]